MGRRPSASLAPVKRDERDKPLPGGPWRVRWSEWVDEGGERKRKQRERVFRHPEGSTDRTAPHEATEFHAEVLRAVRDGELPEEVRLPIQKVVGTFDDGCRTFMQHKVTRGLARSSLTKYQRATLRWLKSARRVLGLADDAPIPLDMLSRDLFEKVIADWRAAGLSEATVYGSARVVLDAWTFCADEPANHPGCPPAPRTKSRILPVPPEYVAPPAPTLAEADACIRRIPSWAYVARGVAIIARYTGLRAGQILALRREDVDVDALTMTVNVAKTRRERAAPPDRPISRHMLDDLARAGCLDHDGPWFLRRRRDMRAEPNRNHQPAATIKKAWQAATAAGEARRSVWAPPNRKIARPEHAFRACVQAHLQGAGVASEVIDAIVGHAGTSTRSRHYAGPAEAFPAARAAIDEHLPPIDWGPQEGEAGNVVSFPG